MIETARRCLPRPRCSDMGSLIAPLLCCMIKRSSGGTNCAPSLFALGRGSAGVNCPNMPSIQTDWCSSVMLSHGGYIRICRISADTRPARDYGLLPRLAKPSPTLITRVGSSLALEMISSTSCMVRTTEHAQRLFDGDLGCGHEGCWRRHFSWMWRQRGTIARQMSAGRRRSNSWAWGMGQAGSFWLQC
jgi:hypothetical protein